MVNLATSDVVEAKRRRDELEGITRLQFRQLKGGRSRALELPDWANAGGRTKPLSLAERGALARESIQIAKDMPDPTTGDEDDYESPHYLAVYAAEAHAESLRPAERTAFEDALAGRVQINHHLDDFLSTPDLAPKTVMERRGLVGRLSAWCSEKGIKLDRVDRRTAGRYVSEVIDPMHPATQTKHLTALRAYWKFLARRGHVSLPDGEQLDSGWPWNGQQRENRGKRLARGTKREKERPYTDDEVRRLLYAPFPMKQAEWEAQIRDALRISLLSGMRLAEVVTLWVEEVHDGVFDIQQGKTEAAARKVPIHPDLREIVETRSRGKAPKDWLFHELQGERDPGDTFGKRFKRFREGVGVDDRRESVRRSLVNFHSARRWFATKARHAGQPRETIADVLGHRHDKKDMTFGVYARDASEAQRRECVEAVKLPTEQAHARAVA
jgi:integrase